MLQGEENVGGVELGCVLLESADLTEVEEELASWAVLETEEKLLLGLESEVHLYDKPVAYTFLLINVG